MMMPSEVGVETCTVLRRAESLDQADVLEPPECTVDGVLRDSRHTFPYAPVHSLGVGMVAGFGDFPEDLQPLMGDFGA